MASARVAVTAAALAALLHAGAAPAEPAPGRYAAELCVSLGAQAANCGAVAAEVREPRSVTLRHSDIAYELQLHSSQVDVVLRQGPTTLDWFVANYDWQGDELRFYDAQKRVRYAVRFGPRHR